MHGRAEPAKAYPFQANITAHQLDSITAAIQSQFNRATTHLDPDNTTGTQETLILPGTVTEIAAENNSTTIFPIPIEMIKPFLGRMGVPSAEQPTVKSEQALLSGSAPSQLTVDPALLPQIKIEEKK